MIATTIGAMLFFAFFIERAIEKFVSDPEQRGQWWLVLVAIGAGIVCAFGFGLDAVSVFLNSLGGETFVARVPFLGTVITGIAIGFGSTFIHDMFKPKEEPTVVVNTTGKAAVKKT